MKLNTRLIYGFVLALGFLNSCKDDEGPKLQFLIGDKDFSLKGAQLYLTHETTYNGRVDRYYVISDGMYTNHAGHYGFDFDDFDNETFYLGFELLSVVGGELTIGEFPVYESFSTAPDNSTAGSFYMEAGYSDWHPNLEYITCRPGFSGRSQLPIAIGGGLEEGKKMMIKFNRTIRYYHYNGTSWLEEEVMGNLYYKGPVIDVR